ncbi:MAG: hypothetical protein GY804_14095 [Alphaproteobacteria bacterium]|nr:hypothetical protein [Alphaproteobacteria bacterium]
MKNSIFTFTSYNFESGKAILCYSICDKNNPNDRYDFKEAISFEDITELSLQKMSEQKKEALLNSIKFLHLAAGISYYKAFTPDKIVIKTGDISKETADFFNDFYFYGLGEFAYKNNINLNALRDKISFPYTDGFEETSSNISLASKITIPVGGGKDSTVTLEALKSALPYEKLSTISVGNPKPIADTVAISGLPHILIKRSISPTLIELNKRDDILNGHVPITGIIAFILATSAVLYDFCDVAMSNERSANVGNITNDEGISINHQWSKSLEFEKSINQFFKSNVLSNFEYFSFLRPLSELHIAKLFAELDNKKYHSVFTSCNKAFKLDENKRIEHWCGDCDKCRFVFLALAPFMEKQDLLKTFNDKNLLNDINQKSGYEELLGLSNFKPFECVGEIEECIAALSVLTNHKDWKYDLLITSFGKALFNNTPYTNSNKKMLEEALKPSSEYNMPVKYKEILNEYTGT